MFCIRRCGKSRPSSPGNISDANVCPILNKIGYFENAEIPGPAIESCRAAKGSKTDN
jgi:hypothetical protein